MKTVNLSIFLALTIICLSALLCGCGSNVTGGGGGGGYTTGFSYPLVGAYCFGGISYEGSQGMCLASDGGVVISGTAVSDDGDVTGHHSGGDQGWDFWIVKTSKEGTLEWQSCIGGSGDEYARRVNKTTDGGYIVGGESSSNDGDVKGNHGSNDFLAVKLTANGTTEWAKLYGGSLDDQGREIIQTTDGGYIFVGYAQSSDGDLTLHYGDSDNYDYWVVKMSSTGDIEWQKTLGGTSDDFARSVCEAPDGGYLVAGYSNSTDEVVSGHHGDNTTSDIWIVKLTSNGTMEWQKSIGGSQDDGPWSIKESSDGGFLITGYTFSNDGQISGNHGAEDALLIKLNTNGTIEWQHCYGGSGGDYSNDIIPVSGGYLIAGSSSSNDGDLTGNHGSSDFWLFLVDTSGNHLYSKNYGGISRDRAYSITEVSSFERQYMISGQTDTHSATGEVIGNHGDSDIWLIKVRMAVM